MYLPPDFHFSQNNLQDFVDCPRRFELKYIMKLEWPALKSEPVIEQEYRMRQGQIFHQMIHQYFLNIPVPKITRFADEYNLSIWWSNFLKFCPVFPLPAQKLPEHTISIPFQNYRLTAKYDLLVVEANLRTIILDWKTSSKIPRRNFLQQRLQTRIYPFIIAETSVFENNSLFSFQPQQIQMVYWFAEKPSKPEIFEYNDTTHSNNKLYLSNLIQNIIDLPEGGFPMTTNEVNCKYCNYRSLCQRGISAGLIHDAEDDETLAEKPFSLDFESIEEIEF